MRYRMAVRQEPSRHLFVREHRGPYTEMARSFDKAFALFLARNRFDQVLGVIGIYYHDPSSVRRADLRALAGIAVSHQTPRPDGLDDLTLTGGKTAVLRYQGPYSGLPMAYEWLFGLWLPASGHLAADAPPYEIYVNLPIHTAPEHLLTDICVTLR